MLTLYQFRHSPFCLKTRMALDAKQIQYHIKEVTPGIGQLEIFQLSGQKQLPVIRDENDHIVNDSSNICEYIDNKNEINNLFPEDPLLLSQAKLIEDWADTTMASLCKKLLIKSALENPQLRTALIPDEFPSSIREIIDKFPINNVNKLSNFVFSNKDNIELQKLLEMLSKSLINKKFLVGDNLSIADISISAQLSLLKFPSSAGPILAGEGCPEFINNPYLDNLFQWRDELDDFIFCSNSL